MRLWFQVRYLYMYKFGGVYADLDCQCRRPFEHMLDRPVVFGGMTYSSERNPHLYIQNSFMASAPNQIIWLKVRGGGSSRRGAWALTL